MIGPIGYRSSTAGKRQITDTVKLILSRKTEEFLWI